jgi:hypothetical protein
MDELIKILASQIDVVTAQAGKEDPRYLAGLKNMATYTIGVARLLEQGAGTQDELSADKAYRAGEGFLASR